MSEFSFKELYDVTLKATYPIEVDGMTFEPGEVIAFFDKIAVADFREDKSFVTAHGGYQDAPRVIWESTKDIRVNFSQGVFSKVQFALLNNARVLRKDNDTGFSVSKRERLETDEDGQITLAETPSGAIYVRCASDGVKMGARDIGENKYVIYELSDERQTAIEYLDVIVDYTYDYKSRTISIMSIGNQITSGFLQFEGKTRVKDDVTGRNVTALIKIPKLKLTSSLSIRLGKNANPVVSNFSGLAVPGARKDNRGVVEIIYLEDDIDADIY